MANRFPLVLDTTDGNKIKELPDGDNLDLTNTSITSVNDINAVGTITTERLLVGGNTVSPVNFLDLVDTPTTFAGTANYFVKVNSSGDGIDFRPLTDLGTLNVDSILSTGDLKPSVDGVGNVGTEAKKFNEVVATTLKGNLVSYNEEIVFDATSGKVSYGALQGAPQFLSEFSDDVGYLQTADLDDTLSSLFDEGVPFESDIKGSVFGDDSTVIVDGVAGLVVGNIQNQNIESANIVAGDITVTDVEVNGTFVFNGAQSVGLTILDSVTGVGGLTLTTDGTLAEELIDITPALADGEVNINANKIRLLGDVSTPITASGGFVGDLTGSVVSDNSTVVIDGVSGKIVSPYITGTATFENNVVVVGNLVVQGTTTEINSTTLTVDDLNIVVANGAADATAANGAGITVEGSNATLTYTSADDRWNFNKELNVDRVHGNLTGDMLGNLTGDTAGTHTGPVVGDVTGNAAGAHTGTFDGEVTGSVFGDDSTVLVDGNNNKVVGDIETESLKVSSQSIALGNGSSAGSEAVSIGKGSNAGDYAQAIGNNAGNSGQGVSAVAIGSQAGETNQGDKAIAIGQYAGKNNQAANSIVLNATGATLENTAADSFVVKPVRDAVGTTVMMYNDTNGEVTHTATPGTLAADLDQTTVAIGATTATAVNIGNAGSTTTINGTVSFGTALVANNITSDDSITLQTNGNTSNEAINLAPQGTGNTINLTSQNIRFFGPITNNVNFVGGLNGDLNGSIYGDDSTLLIDGVNSTISAGNIAGSLPAIDGSNLTGVIASSVDFTNVANTPTTIAGYGIIDAASSAQGILAETALQEGDTFDVRGSVFADDSSLLVDALNGEIPGYVKIADLKTALQDGAGDYAAFKSWALANL
jgi:hypothetical protein